jgi:hypothetical protein
MKLTDEEMKQLYQQQTTRTVRRQTECLSAEMLMRAAAGEISQPERERLADHLIACSDCAQEYRLVESLKPWSEQVAALDGKPASEAAPAYESEPLPVEQRVRQSHTGWWQWLAAIFTPARLSTAMAAGLLIISLSLVAWMVSRNQESRRLAERLNEQLAEREQAVAAATESLEETRRQLEETARRNQQYESQIAELRQNVDELSRNNDELSRPHLNVAIADLDPRDSVRGSGASTPRTIEVSARASIFTLILNVEGQPSHPNYGLEILSQSGKLVWRGRGLKKSAYNTFTLALPRRLLPAGQYRFKLYGAGSGRTELVEEYAARIRYR